MGKLKDAEEGIATAVENAIEGIEGMVGKAEDEATMLDDEAKAAIGEAIRTCGIPLNETALKAVADRVATSLETHLKRIFGEA